MSASAAAGAAGTAGPTRDEMLEAVARQFESLGYRVYTRGGVGGRAEPVPTNGHDPDLRARGFDGVILAVVEMPETIFGAESEARWKAFGSSYFSFHLIAPGALAAEARRLARERGVRVERFWLF